MNGFAWFIVFIVFIWTLIFLCSCTVQPRARIVYHGTYGDYSYSAKSGLEVDVKNLVHGKLEITVDK